MYTIRQAAQLTGIGPRRLRFFRQMGLLNPENSSPSGPRLYTGDDLLRFQQILLYQELGFTLTEIRRLLTIPGLEYIPALNGLRELYQVKIEHLERIVDTIDGSLDQLNNGTTPTNELLFENLDPAIDRQLRQRYMEKLREAYDPELMAASHRLGRALDEAAFADVTNRQEALHQLMAEHYTAGFIPESPEAQSDMATYHTFIDENLYPCNAIMFRGLGELYCSDSRFTGYFDAFAAGFATYLSRAIAFYSDNMENA